MREKLTAGGSDEHTLDNQKVSASALQAGCSHAQRISKEG
jgi:hypothetical protein